MGGHIFYILSLFLLLGNINVLRNFYTLYEHKDWADRYKIVIGSLPKKKQFDTRSYSKYTTYISIEAMNIVWLLLGIVSNSWMVYLTLIFILALTNYLNRYIESLHNIAQKLRFKINISIRFVYHIILTFTMAFLILNHFHFHINIFDFLLF